MLLESYFPISQSKNLGWDAQKHTIHVFKLMDKKIITILLLQSFSYLERSIGKSEKNNFLGPFKIVLLNL